MTTLFTADLHFGHVNMTQQGNDFCNRGFASVEQMNETLIRNWNAVVGHDDTVYIVGDFAMGKIAETLPLAQRLRGRKILVLGNHDRPFDKPEGTRWWIEYERYFAQVVRGPIRVEEFVVCHFPYDKDERHGDRLAEHNPPDEGELLIHGHIHDMWQFNDRQINVGVDVWDFRPVSIDEIRRCLRDGDL